MHIKGVFNDPSKSFTQFLLMSTPKPDNSIDQLMGQFTIAEPMVKCSSGNRATRVCVSQTCQVNALHCQKTTCENCGLDHKPCTTVSLASFTQNVQRLTENQKNFFSKMLEVEQEVIQQIKERRKTLAASLSFGNLKEEDRRAVENMFRGKASLTGREAGNLKQVLRTSQQQKISEEEQDKILQSLRESMESIDESLKKSEQKAINIFYKRQKLGTVQKKEEIYQIILVWVSLTVISAGLAISEEKKFFIECMFCFSTFVLIIFIISQILNFILKRVFIAVYLKMGQYHAKANKYDLALKYFENIIDLTPKSKKIHFYIGNSLFQLQRYREAVKRYKKTIQIDPSFKNAYYNMATALFFLEDFEEADKCLDKLIKLDPAVTDRSLYQMKRECLQKLGRTEELKSIQQIMDSIADAQKTSIRSSCQ